MVIDNAARGYPFAALSLETLTNNSLGIHHEDGIETVSLARELLFANSYRACQFVAAISSGKCAAPTRDT